MRGAPTGLLLWALIVRYVSCSGEEERSTFAGCVAPCGRRCGLYLVLELVLLGVLWLLL
jgi:hypothetical protein